LLELCLSPTRTARAALLGRICTAAIDVLRTRRGSGHAALATCSVAGCGRPGRNGKASKGKYCDTHIPEGIIAMGQQTRVAADRYWSATARAASLCHPLGSQAIQGGQELLLRGLGEERRGRGATGGGVTAARRVAPRLLPW